MPDTKIQIKLGDDEFTAEGPDDIVKAAFEQFLKAREASPAIVKTPKATDRKGEEPPAGDTGTLPPPPPGDVDQGLLDRVFQKDDDIISLRLLPSRTNPNWQADSAILLLYGFHRLASMSEVPVTKLNQGLRTSGIGVKRVDGIIDVHSGLFMKGGMRSGGRYTLNNQGKAAAERMLKEQFN